jgi:hypothetical protein
LKFYRCIITSCDSFRKDTVWQVFATLAQKGGDIAFVKGANAELFELPVGFSWSDRGVRNDNHDAFGVELAVQVDSASQPVKRKQPPRPEAPVVPKRSVGQPGSSNDDGSSTHLNIRAARTTTTMPPLIWMPAPGSLNDDGLNDSAAQPVGDASQGSP